VARVLRSRLAIQDLYEIWSYVEKNNARAAEKLINEFTLKFSMLARHTGVGTPRPHVDPRARVFPVGRYMPVGRYVIVFRRLEDGIEVMRVVHGARDLKNLKLQKRLKPRPARPAHDWTAGSSAPF